MRVDGGLRSARSTARTVARSDRLAVPWSAAMSTRSHRARDRHQGRRQQPRARHDYAILDTVEAGLVLRGSEVKSLRLGQVQLADAYARVERRRAVAGGRAHRAVRVRQRRRRPRPDRRRKLLLHRDEIDRLQARVAQEHLALVPLRLYFREGRAKVELGLGQGPPQGRQAPGHRRARLPAGDRPRPRPPAQGHGLTRSGSDASRSLPAGARLRRTASVSLIRSLTGPHLDLTGSRRAQVRDHGRAGQRQGHPGRAAGRRPRPGPHQRRRHLPLERAAPHQARRAGAADHGRRRAGRRRARRVGGPRPAARCTTGTTASSSTASRATSARPSSSSRATTSTA